MMCLKVVKVMIELDQKIEETEKKRANLLLLQE